MLTAMLVTLCTGTVWGETTYSMTIDSSNNGSNNVHWTATTVSSLTHATVTWSTSVTGTTSVTANTTYAQIGSKNNPATQVTISTTAFAGKKITAASLTGFCMSNTGPSLTITAGSTSILSNASLVKTNSTPSTPYSANVNLPVTLGNSDALTFTISSSAKAAICISEISVTYEEAGGGSSLLTSDLAITDAPVALNFDLYNNATAQTVSYTTSSTGAVTVSGGTGYVTTSVSGNTITVTPTAVTPSAQTITISQAADATYDAGSKTFTVTVTDSSPITNIAALTAKAAGNYTVSLTDALVTYVHGTNAYLEDASGAVLLYGCAGSLAVGDKITGTADVTYTVYNNLPEVTDITLQTGYTKTTGNTVTPAEVTIATLESNYTSYLSRYVKIVGATVTSAFSSKNSTIEQSGSSIVLRDQNSYATLTTTVNDIVTVTAHPAIYSTTKQIAVYEQSQIVVAKVNPTITFNNGSVRVGNTLDLSTLFTSNSTGAVTYSITSGGGYATLSGSTLTATAEGSVTVKAEQAESGSYNAGEATATITVNPALVLSSIAVTTAPTKTTYNEGETFDPTGMVVTATYSDTSTEDVTASCTYSPNTALSTSDTEITVSYTENAVVRTTTQAITVNAYVQPTSFDINFNNAFFGTNYGGSASGITDENSVSGSLNNVTVTYAGSGNHYINDSQIRFYPNNKLTFEAPSGYNITKIVLTADGTWTATISANVGTYTSDTKTWTGNATSVIFTGSGSGQCRMSRASITLSLPSTDPTINADDVELTAEATSGEIAYTISNPDGSSLTAAEKVDVDWISNVTVDAVNSKVTFTTTANTGAARTGTITLTYGSVTKDVTVTQAAYVAPFQNTTWTLATAITSGKHYIITNGTDKAMGTQNTNNRAAVGVTIENGTATVNSADVYEFVIYGPDASGYYTIYDETNSGYLYAVAGSNYLKNQSTISNTSLWTITFNNENAAVITAPNVTNTDGYPRIMRYNSQNTLFSCYFTGQDNIYLYEKSGEATPTESVTVGDAGYTTYTTVNPVSFPEGVTAYIATQVNTNTIHLEEVADAPARTPLVIQAAEGSYTLTSGTSSASSVSGNLLRSSDGTVTGDGSSYWALSKFNDVVGFNVVGDGVTIPEGKAYLDLSSSSGVKGFLSFDFGSTDGIEAIDNEDSSMVNAQIFNLAGQRVSKAQRGLYIVNGKKVLVK